MRKLHAPPCPLLTYVSPGVLADDNFVQVSGTRLALNGKCFYFQGGRAQLGAAALPCAAQKSLSSAALGNDNISFKMFC
jgi:hypothetical protein